MSRTIGQSWRVVVLSVLIGVGVAATAPALAQATSITEFSGGLSSGAGSIVSGPDGNLWFTESGAIGRITPAGVITEFGTAAGLNPGSMPTDIALGSDGNLWFSDQGTTRAIGRITPAGVITEFGAAAGLNPGSVPENIVPGPDGNLWFIDNGTTPAIGRITPSGTITEFGAADGLNAQSEPNDIAAGPDGNLWFTDEGGISAAIGRVTPAGVIKEFNTLPVPMSLPDEITAGSDGNMWFTDSDMPAIGRITPAGVITDFKPGLQTNSDPDIITTGPDGNVWFTDAYAGQRAVGRVTPAGTISEFTTHLGTGLPDDITTGADGNLWIEQSMDGGVARITPAGVITQFTAGLNPGAGADGDELVPGPDGNLWFTDGGTTPAIGKVSLELAPTATTGAASAVTSSTATVSGSVTPISSAATVAFDYGTTPALGSTVTATTLAASIKASAVTAALSALPPATVIFYRVTATDPFGAVTGTVQTFTTAPAPKSPPVTPPVTPPVKPPHVTTANFGNQQITLTTPSPLSCTATTKTLSVTLTSAAIPKSHATKLHFVSAAFYLDKGVRHTHKKTIHPRHGKKKTVTVVVHTANAVAHRLPATVRLHLTGLSSGPHTLKVTLSYKETVTKHHHKQTVTVTKTVTAKFLVC